jgi:pimeloyl-ACP methyl ester carboxylesterase
LKIEDRRSKITTTTLREVNMRIELEGYGLEVEEHGGGVPFVLIHGFPLSSEMWAPIAPAVGQVARLVTPDLRGFGRSDKPAGDYAMDALADDVIAVVDQIGIERFVLGGHSMGGYVALRMAARFRARLLGFVAVDTRAEGDDGAGKARRQAAIARIAEHGGAAFLADFLPNLLGAVTREKAPRLLDELRAIAAEVPDHVLVSCLEGMIERSDSRPVLPTLNVPALVIVGEEDTVTPPATARALAAALPNAKLEVIPGAGHTPSVERPIATADAVVAFLRSSAFAGVPSSGV